MGCMEALDVCFEGLHRGGGDASGGGVVGGVAREGARGLEVMAGGLGPEDCFSLRVPDDLQTMTREFRLGGGVIPVGPEVEEVAVACVVEESGARDGADVREDGVVVPAIAIWWDSMIS